MTVRASLIRAGVLIPADQVIPAPLRVDALPALLLDDAGRRSAAVDKHNQKLGDIRELFRSNRSVAKKNFLYST